MFGSLCVNLLCQSYLFVAACIGSIQSLVASTFFRCIFFCRVQLNYACATALGRGGGGGGGGFCCCCDRPPGMTSHGTVGWQPRRGETVEEGEESHG